MSLFPCIYQLNCKKIFFLFYIDIKCKLNEIFSFKEKKNVQKIVQKKKKRIENSVGKEKKEWGKWRKESVKNK